MVEISDDEMAYMLVELYVKEIAERGEKKQMGLDTIINAYFYTLQRIQRKKKEMGAVAESVTDEEKMLSRESGKQEMTKWGKGGELA
jgi:hypothetical protein